MKAPRLYGDDYDYDHGGFGVVMMMVMVVVVLCSLFDGGFYSK
jgi:hypothetical protein